MSLRRVVFTPDAWDRLFPHELEDQAYLRAIERANLAGFRYLYFAVRGHFLLELGRRDEAAASFRAGLGYRCSVPERRFLERRLASCESGVAGA